MRKPVAVDLFSGAGGASLGLKWAGFHVIGVDHVGVYPQRGRWAHIRVSLLLKKRLWARLLRIGYFGGKHRMAKKILQLFPPHTNYIEVFGGGGTLLLNKPPSASEIYNDIDSAVVDFFRL